MIFFTSGFFITDLYEFNTNNCLQASGSTKFCGFFNTKAQCAHTCVAVLTPDSLIVKYFMTLCIPDKKNQIKKKSNKLKKSNLNKKIQFFYLKKNLDFFNHGCMLVTCVLNVACLLATYVS